MNNDKVQDYLKRSGDEELLPWPYIENDQGFITYNINEEIFIIGNVYGDGEFWDLFAIEKGKKLGCNKIIFATKRNPAAFERKFGYKVTTYLMEKDIG